MPKADFTISPMRVQHLPFADYLAAKAVVDPAKLDQTVSRLMDKLMQTVDRTDIAGPVICRTQTSDDQPKGLMEVSVGIMVNEGAATGGDLKVMHLPDLRCATVLYSGSLQHLPEAYHVLFRSLKQAGYVPTGETRCYYVYWEGRESSNNIMLVQAGIQ